MLEKYKLPLHTFWQLLRTDMYIFKKIVIGRMIDVTFWLTIFLFVFAFLYPELGMDQGFAAFFAIGAISSCIFWSLWGTTSAFIADLEGNKTIDYYLTLPISSTWVFIRHAVANAIRAATPALMVIPISKVILLDKFSLLQICWWKLSLIFVVYSVFIGLFSLFIASLVKNMNHIFKVEVRILFPLWFMGGTNFPWFILNKTFPKLSYVILANPLLYSMEGMRAAALGQNNYINYWTCLLMLIVWGLIFGTIGIYRLKKRLDCI